MIRVLHIQCGKTAFFFHERLEAGNQICASNVIDLDGNAVEPQSPIVCFSCREPFIPGDSTCEQQHWTDWFVVNESLRGEAGRRA